MSRPSFFKAPPSNSHQCVKLCYFVVTYKIVLRCSYYVALHGYVMLLCIKLQWIVAFQKSSSISFCIVLQFVTQR